jgi:F-type H+-transporting ATPase subunit gamma
VVFEVIGRKGRDYLERRGAQIAERHLGVFDDPVGRAGEIGRGIVDRYTRQELDAIYLVYSEFKSAISQRPVVEPILPIEPAEIDPDALGDFIYEPDKQALLDTLLPMYVEVEVRRAIYESVASEHGARMTAMDAATNNANDLIKKLTLQYNRARQAAITKELMEIIGGAEALAG